MVRPGIELIRQTSDDFDMLYAAITKQIGRPEFKKQGQPHPSMDPRNLRKIKEKIEKCPIHVGPLRLSAD